MDELDDPERENERTDHDFRANRAARYVAYLDEARDFAHRMIEGNIDWPGAVSGALPARS